MYASDETAFETSAHQKPRSPVIAVAWIVVLSAVIAYCYWKFIFYPSTPHYALDRFFAAAKSRDYDTVYGLVHATGLLKSTVPNSRALRDIAEKVPGIVPEVESYRYLKSKHDGDRAMIETSATTRTIRGISSNVLNVEMERVNGAWMIDGQWIVREAYKRGLGALLIRGSEGF